MVFPLPGSPSLSFQVLCSSCYPRFPLSLKFVIMSCFPFLFFSQFVHPVLISHSWFSWSFSLSWPWSASLLFFLLKFFTSCHPFVSCFHTSFFPTIIICLVLFFCSVLTHRHLLNLAHYLQISLIPLQWFPSFLEIPFPVLFSVIFILFCYRYWS